MISDSESGLPDVFKRLAVFKRGVEELAMGGSLRLRGDEGPATGSPSDADTSEGLGAVK